MAQDGSHHTRGRGDATTSYVLELDDNLFRLLETFETAHLFNLALRRCVGSSACAFAAVMLGVIDFLLSSFKYIFAWDASIPRMCLIPLGEDV